MTDIEYIRERMKTLSHLWIETKDGRWVVIADGRFVELVEGSEADALDCLLTELVMKDQRLQVKRRDAEIEERGNDAVIKELQYALKAVK